MKAGDRPWLGYHPANVPHADFDVVKVDKIGGRVFIVDNDGRVTVTNDAKRVCSALNAVEFPGWRILCRGTDNVWAELIHEAGVFKSFKIAEAEAREAGLK